MSLDLAEEIKKILSSSLAVNIHLNGHGDIEVHLLLDGNVISDNYIAMTDMKHNLDIAEG